MKPNKSITSKATLKTILSNGELVYSGAGINGFIEFVRIEILTFKIRFPLLEYVGLACFEMLSDKDQLIFCEQVFRLKTIGGNVLIGIIFQNRLKTDTIVSLKLVAGHVSHAHIWYVSDIIGERTFGFSLLNYPDKVIPLLAKMFENENRWVVRSIGAGCHYAIKKGLDADNVLIVFDLLLIKANSKDKEERQGVGWAAKTTAKFHLAVINARERELKNEGLVANWFRRKIKTGLERNEYAKRNSR